MRIAPVLMARFHFDGRFRGQPISIRGIVEGDRHVLHVGSQRSKSYVLHSRLNARNDSRNSSCSNVDPCRARKLQREFPSAYCQGRRGPSARNMLKVNLGKRSPVDVFLSVVRELKSGRIVRVEDEKQRCKTIAHKQWSLKFLRGFLLVHKP